MPIESQYSKVYGTASLDIRYLIYSANEIAAFDCSLGKILYKEKQLFEPSEPLLDTEEFWS